MNGFGLVDKYGVNWNDLPSCVAEIGTLREQLVNCGITEDSRERITWYIGASALAFGIAIGWMIGRRR